MKINFNHIIMILGGDLRQKYVFQKLNTLKYTIFSNGVIDVPDTDFHMIAPVVDTYLLPIPFSKDHNYIYGENCQISIQDFIDTIHPKSTIIGGGFTPDFIEMCSKKQLILYDILKSDSFSKFNSVATAEAAISIAIKQSPYTLSHSHSIVLGYGKCGKEIADLTKKLGSETTICERKAEKSAKILANDFRYTDFVKLPDMIGKFEFIFNTVPSMVLNQDVIKNISKNAVIIDIASKPGGTDFEYCKAEGIDANLYLALPGKYSPASSADAILSCII